MATFTYVPSFSATESSKPRVRTFKAGDGYEQRIRMGLRNDPKTWQLTFSERTDSEASSILAFLEARAGAESFDWTPPQRLGGNRLLWSEAFDNAVWTKNFVGVTPNAIASPTGAVTADKITESTTTSGYHNVYEVNSIIIGQRVTFSVYLKAAERTLVQIQLSNTVDSVAYADINLSTGTVISAFATGTTITSPVARVTNEGNGWYRCSIAASKGNLEMSLGVVQLVSGAGTYLYAGTVGSGLYAFGAQLELGDSASTYTSTTTSTAGVVAAGKYVCEEWDATMRSANFNNITATFRQVFEA